MVSRPTFITDPPAGPREGEPHFPAVTWEGVVCVVCSDPDETAVQWPCASILPKHRDQDLIADAREQNDRWELIRQAAGPQFTLLTQLDLRRILLRDNELADALEVRRKKTNGENFMLAVLMVALTFLARRIGYRDGCSARLPYADDAAEEVGL